MTAAAALPLCARCNAIRVTAPGATLCEPCARCAPEPPTPTEEADR